MLLGKSKQHVWEDSLGKGIVWTYHTFARFAEQLRMLKISCIFYPDILIPNMSSVLR